MFDTDIKHYAPAPRRLSESKWGPYSELSCPESPAYRRQRLIDILLMTAATLGAFIAAALIGVLAAWNG